MVVGAAALTIKTAGPASPPTIDCGAMLVDDGFNCGGSWDCGGAIAGRVVAGATTTMSKRTSALAPMTAADAAAMATMAVMHCPLLNRQRIAGPSRESRRKNSDDSVEGEDRRRRRGNNGWTRRWQCLPRSAGCEGNALPTMSTATGSGKSGQGRMTKATNESRRTMTVSD